MKYLLVFTAHVLTFLLFVVVPSRGLSSPGPIVVVVNRGSPIESISLDELNQFYAAENKFIGRDIVTLILPAPKSPEMDFLIKKVLKKNSESDLFQFYLKLIFQQKLAAMPPKYNAAQALMEVQKNTSAIALVDQDVITDPGSVKVIPIGGM